LKCDRNYKLFAIDRVVLQGL